MKLALAELRVTITQAWNLLIWMVVVCIRKTNEAMFLNSVSVGTIVA